MSDKKHVRKQLEAFDSPSEKPTSRKRGGHLNALQAAQLQDCIADGRTVKVGNVSRSSLNKGYLDTPLFTELVEKQQTKLF